MLMKALMVRAQYMVWSLQRFPRVAARCLRMLIDEEFLPALIDDRLLDEILASQAAGARPGHSIAATGGGVGGRIQELVLGDDSFSLFPLCLCPYPAISSLPQSGPIKSSYGTGRAACKLPLQAHIEPGRQTVFTARRLAKRGICRRRVSVCLSVCPSVCVCVCPSHSGIVSKRLNVGSRK